MKVHLLRTFPGVPSLVEVLYPTSQFFNQGLTPPGLTPPGLTPPPPRIPTNPMGSTPTSISSSPPLRPSEEKPFRSHISSFDADDAKPSSHFKTPDGLQRALTSGPTQSYNFLSPFLLPDLWGSVRPGKVDVDSNQGKFAAAPFQLLQQRTHPLRDRIHNPCPLSETTFGSFITCC